LDGSGRIWSSSSDKVIKIWNVERKRLILQIEEKSVAYSFLNVGDKMWVAFSNGTIQIYRSAPSSAYFPSSLSVSSSSSSSLTSLPSSFSYIPPTTSSNPPTSSSVSSSHSNKKLSSQYHNENEHFSGDFFGNAAFNENGDFFNFQQPKKINNHKKSEQKLISDPPSHPYSHTNSPPHPLHSHHSSRSKKKKPPKQKEFKIWKSEDGFIEIYEGNKLRKNSSKTSSSSNPEKIRKKKSNSKEKKGSFS
jgi:hypothetical protein